MPAAGTRVVVLGLGASGAGVARYLHANGVSVVVADDGDGEALRRRAQSLPDGVDVRLGLHLGAGDDDATRAAAAAVLAGADRVVASPGVPPTQAVLRAAAAAGIPTCSELELASLRATAPIVAVTGTNGKTTVVTLLGELYAAAGVPTVVCGNIGTPAIDVVGDVGPEGIIVVEASSFQLALTERFHARAGVFLNLAADHLDWHRDMDDYADAKARIWANQTTADLAVANADDPLTLARLAAATGRHATFAPHSVDGAGVGIEDGRFVAHRLGGIERCDVMAVDELAGGATAPHDLANAAAALAVALDTGVPAEVAAGVLRRFVRPAHRREFVGEVRGVQFVDDSKATNPHAAVAAVRGFDRVVLIAGGKNKGLDLSALTEAVDRIVAVVAIGDAADEVRAAFEPTGRTVAVAGSMPAAVKLAAGAAKPGDVVLLSPGCASFDWFSGYKERGEAFAAAVRDLIAAEERT